MIGAMPFNDPDRISILRDRPECFSVLTEDGTVISSDTPAAVGVLSVAEGAAGGSVWTAPAAASPAFACSERAARKPVATVVIVKTNPNATIMTNDCNDKFDRRNRCGGRGSTGCATATAVSSKWGEVSGVCVPETNASGARGVSSITTVCSPFVQIQVVLYR
jgi:hypothetical protein